MFALHTWTQPEVWPGEFLCRFVLPCSVFSSDYRATTSTTSSPVCPALHALLLLLIVRWQGWHSGTVAHGTPHYL